MKFNRLFALLFLAMGLIVANAVEADDSHSDCTPEITSHRVPPGSLSMVIMGNCLNKITQVVMANSDGSGSGYKAVAFTTTQTPAFKTDLLVTLTHLEQPTEQRPNPPSDRKLKIQTCNEEKRLCRDKDYIWIRLPPPLINREALEKMNPPHE